MSATAKMRGAYASSAQIDAVAAARFSSPGVSSSDDSDAGGAAHTLLAVAQSSLEGNQWGGIVSLVDASSYEQLCAFQLASGVSGLAWCGIDGDVLALACDNGDVQLVRAAQIDGDGGFAFVPQSGGGRAIDEDAEEEPASSSSFNAGWGHDDVVTSVSASHFEKTKIATGSWDLTYDLICIELPFIHQWLRNDSYWFVYRVCMATATRYA